RHREGRHPEAIVGLLPPLPVGFEAAAAVLEERRFFDITAAELALPGWTSPYPGERSRRRAWRSPRPAPILPATIRPPCGAGAFRLLLTIGRTARHDGKPCIHRASVGVATKIIGQDSIPSSVAFPACHGKQWSGRRRGTVQHGSGRMMRPCGLDDRLED